MSNTFTPLVELHKTPFCGLQLKAQKATFPAMSTERKNYPEIAARLKAIRSGLTDMT